MKASWHNVNGLDIRESTMISLHYGSHKVEFETLRSTTLRYRTAAQVMEVEVKAEVPLAANPTLKIGDENCPVTLDSNPATQNYVGVRGGTSNRFSPTPRSAEVSSNLRQSRLGMPLFSGSSDFSPKPRPLVELTHSRLNFRQQQPYETVSEKDLPLKRMTSVIIEPASGARVQAVLLWALPGTPPLLFPPSTK
ncbi:uncharacterized protein FOMMEDRAFT_154145 [Fomitiporia mediterranea MF3/22]|uniref:uncharacterized protein n=1 Tax=Fomitiporia mediterranea (strain MF3/22) TaxID=694068 RepID=UPI0004408DD4|nr:uncharacterized protein FOMMEDRAFT_154145 [Fomitiporia mediterranea MF3/22]EJD04987.1 hypothetical protein FOMMEDRAFT_154145 [Fomitiporia mediterranea MF3/22]